MIGHRLRDLDDAQSGLAIGDLLDFVEHATESMAIFRVLNPDGEWTLTNQLLASILDRLNLDAWAAGGGKGRRPKPIPRPGITDKEQKQYKTQSSSVVEMDEWLASRVKSA